MHLIFHNLSFVMACGTPLNHELDCEDLSNTLEFAMKRVGDIDKKTASQ